jgi:hypothetical protein
MKSASVYFFRDRIIVNANSRTTSGVWVIDSEAYVIPANDSEPTEVGALVLKVLDQSKAGVPHPASWAGQFLPVLEAAGVRTMTAFMKHAYLLQSELNELQLSLIPTVNLGTKDGFAEQTDIRETFETFDAREVGDAVLRLLKNAVPQSKAIKGVRQSKRQSKEAIKGVRQSKGSGSIS